MIETARLRLRPWSETDGAAFTALHADPAVMRDRKGPIDAAHSSQKLGRYRSAYDRLGFCRWALESLGGNFLGYVGVMPSRPSHPLGPHLEIGWRLVREAWGHGFATEAAEAALADVFRRYRPREVLCYTAPDNFRSRAVAGRLGLRRDPARDFDTLSGKDPWHGLVWVAKSA